MSDSPERQKKVFVKCPKCHGHKGIYGRSATGHPATLPCPRCNATGEVDISPLIPEVDDDTFFNATKKWGW